MRLAEELLGIVMVIAFQVSRTLAPSIKVTAIGAVACGGTDIETELHEFRGVLPVPASTRVLAFVIP